MTPTRAILLQKMSASPVNKVHVTVLGAEGLADMDTIGVSDPFCIVRVGAKNSQMRQTQVVKNCLSPRWDETFNIDVFAGDFYVIVEVYDSDVGHDDPLGLALVPLASISVGEPVTAWFRLGRLQVSGPMSGRVQLALHLENEFSVRGTLSTDGKKAASFNSELLEVTNRIPHVRHKLVVSGDFTKLFPGKEEKLELILEKCILAVSGSMCNGRLYLTNYRLMFIGNDVLREFCPPFLLKELLGEDADSAAEADTSSSNRSRRLARPKSVLTDITTSIPLGLINAVETVNARHLIDKNAAHMLTLTCSDFRILNFVIQPTSKEQSLQVAIYSLSRRLRFHVMNQPLYDVMSRVQPLPQEVETRPHSYSIISTVSDYEDLPPLDFGGEAAEAVDDEKTGAVGMDGTQSPVLSERDAFSCWYPFDLESECERMKVPMDRFRITTVNEQYELCASYPHRLLTLKSISDDLLMECAEFRSKNRVPVVSWYDSTTGAMLLRSSQPMPGITGTSSPADEAVLGAYRSAVKADSDMLIIDCRSFVAAGGNVLKGKGTENVEKYDRCRLLHLDIANIHAIRSSFDKLHALCTSTSAAENDWYNELHSTEWMWHLHTILRGVTTVVRYMVEEECCVLVHCSDGWDRTAQITSLTMLLMGMFFCLFVCLSMFRFPFLIQPPLL